ncbi:MAG TPA: TetR/AcrR family transcriptional regulator [Gemmatimonadaceae bacterium]|nr:TetR/AcrR family transcriptional regulator [Gemmatimonadaceae bacterium]
MTSDPAARVREPRQARSLETYERMLDAAEEILLETSFDDATVAEVAGRAGVTIGAFYARFADKDALLRQLELRMEKDFIALNADNDDEIARLTLEALVLNHHRRLIGVYRRRRAIARALVLRSHTDPALRRRIEKLNTKSLPRFARSLREHAYIDHPQPIRAIQFALVAVRSVCREVILFRESWPNARPLTDQELAKELTRQFLTYLGARSKRK